MPYILFVMLCSLFIPNHATYIDTRDISKEKKEIKLILEDMKEIKASTKGGSKKEISLITASVKGLTLNTGMTFANMFPGDHLYCPFGSGDMGMGVMNRGWHNSQKKKLEQEKIRVTKDEQQISEIISNLVVTDKDFIKDHDQLERALTGFVNTNIQQITESNSNSIRSLYQEVKEFESKFQIQTNTLTVNIQKLRATTRKTVDSNNKKLDKIDLSNEEKNILKKSNHKLETMLQKEEKKYISQVKQIIKTFHRSYAKLQKKNQKQVEKLQYQQEEQLKSIVEQADAQKEVLYQKYIKSYIQKVVTN